MCEDEDEQMGDLRWKREAFISLELGYNSLPEL